MRIRPAIIIPAILALGIAGAALSVAEISAAATHASTVQVQETTTITAPGIMYHG
jgi:hypothetical protein